MDTSHKIPLKTTVGRGNVGEDVDDDDDTAVSWFVLESHRLAPSCCTSESKSGTSTSPICCAVYVNGLYVTDKSKLFPSSLSVPSILCGGNLCNIASIIGA